MKRVLTIVVVLAAIVTGLGSCDKGSSYTKLQQSYDSLVVQNTRNQQELENVLGLIMDVEQEIGKVSTAENKLRIGQATGEFSENDRQQLIEDIRDMTSSLEKNKEELNKKLEELKRKDINISTLNKKISQLQQQIVQKENTIAHMSAVLASKDSLITAQSNRINELAETTGVQEATIALQDKTISEQTKQLNAAYYCFGTSSELRDQKIISGGGLFSRPKVEITDANRDYFMKIDIREMREIPLYAPEAKVLTEHPSSSYELIKDGNKNLILKIEDAESFWSRGRYLVIEVRL